MANRRHRIDSKAVRKGRNVDLGDWEDDRWVHCKRCGHVCNLDRDLRVPDGSRLGWGTDLTTNTYGDDDRANPTVTGGCPFCGSYRYTK